MRDATKIIDTCFERVSVIMFCNIKSSELASAIRIKQKVERDTKIEENINRPS